MTTKLKTKLAGKRKTDTKAENASTTPGGSVRSYSHDALNFLDSSQQHNSVGKGQQQQESSEGYANSEIIELERSLKHTSFYTGSDVTAVVATPGGGHKNAAATAAGSVRSGTGSTTRWIDHIFRGTE